MALFQRTARDSGATRPADARPGRRATFDLKPLLGGLTASLIGLGAAAALLWSGLQHAQEEQRTQLASAWGQSQASALQQALRQLHSDAQSSIRLLHVTAALPDAEARRAIERSLRELPGVVDAHLNPRGRVLPDSSRPGPMNYAAMELLQRVENGQSPAPEAYRIGERWLLYSAIALPGERQAVGGTLLLVSDLERLLATLPRLPGEAGQLQLTQQFPGAPAQQLLQSGQASGDSQPLVLASGNPHWTLSFQPGRGAAATLSPLSLLGAAVLALAGLLIGLQLVLGRQQRRLRDDVLQINRLLQELSTGKLIQIPALSLPALDALARNMARLPVRPAGAAPTHAFAATAAVARQARPNEQIEPRRAVTDTLDIDILDEAQDPFGLDTKERETAMSSATAPNLPASIFRAYDIRGVVGDSLTNETAYWIGRAVGSQSLAQGEPNVSVGRDGRLSGPQLVEHLIQGLLDSGCNVSDVGMVPTPALYYAANVLAGKSGVMLTGSHNPPDYNGFKIVIAGDTLANEQIQALRRRIETGDLSEGAGTARQVDILERYFEEIRSDIAMARQLKVVVDCGNGVAGVIAPRLIEALGCQVIPLFCEVDGNFPNHHPDPGKLENLVDLIAKVKAEKADLGLAFDGDGDRVGVVTNTGNVIYPDRLLMLFAQDVISRNPGADIIFDVKCTRRLTPLISSFGGRPVMWKTGHSLIKKKMKESGALLAGEMSGHIFFKERWFGFDDGIYSAARLLEILSQDKRDAEQVFAAFPGDISTPEINITVTEESKFTIIDALQRDAQWGEANLITLDGVRVDYPRGWGLIRASNTTPVLVLRFEAESEEELKRIQDVFRAQLLNVAPDLKLPF